MLFPERATPGMMGLVCLFGFVSERLRIVSQWHCCVRSCRRPQRSGYPNNDEFGINNDGFCIQNDEFGINYDGLCIQNDEFGINNDGFCIQNDEFGINYDGLCIQNDEFWINDDGFCRSSWCRCRSLPLR